DWDLGRWRSTQRNRRLGSGSAGAVIIWIAPIAQLQFKIPIPFEGYLPLGTDHSLHHLSCGLRHEPALLGNNFPYIGTLTEDAVYHGGRRSQSRPAQAVMVDDRPNRRKVNTEAQQK